MSTIEFDELQKIWDVQNNQTLYAINEKALHNHVISKKNKSIHITNISELLLIVVNTLAGGFVLISTYIDRSPNIFLYLLAVWMFATALYTLLNRVSRLKGENNFERSISGDLNYAISVASYQVRLSGLMRWNILPIGILILLGIWDGGKSVWLAGFIFVFFCVTYYASGFEHSFYKNRKRELEVLKAKLEKETVDEN